MGNIYYPVTTTTTQIPKPGAVNSEPPTLTNVVPPAATLTLWACEEFGVADFDSCSDGETLAKGSGGSVCFERFRVSSLGFRVF